VCCTAKAIWARSSLIRARWNSVSAPASVVASSAIASFEGAGPEFGLRRSQRPLGAARGVGGQPRRVLQEGRRRRQPAARLRPAGRALELGADLLVGFRRGLGAMPGAAIRIDRRIARVGQRPMRALPLLPCCGRIDGRAHQRVTEPHAGANVDQAVRLFRRSGPYVQPRGRAPQQRRVANRVGGGHEEELLGLGWEGFDPLPEPLFDATGERRRSRQAEAARQLGCAPAAGELQQRERVALGLGDDPVGHQPVDAPRDHGRQQRQCVGTRKPLETQLGQP
jgi:hypothetical protein